MDTQQLKKLQVAEAQLQKEIAELEHNKHAVQHTLSKAKIELNKIRKRLRSKNTGGFTITEHAQLRYLERVTGIDLKMIKEAILPKEGIEILKEFGFVDGLYPMGTHSIRVKNNCIITVLKP